MNHYTEETLRKQFMESLTFISNHVKQSSSTIEEAVDSTIHAILATIDGVNDFMPTPITLVAEEMSEENKAYRLEDGDPIVDEEIVLNDSVYLHDEWGEYQLTVPRRPFYPALLKRYESMLTAAENKGRFPETKELSHSHLLWMLSELRTNVTQSPTKKHRWLGYIQHALCVAGITTVDAERDFTRDIFNGN